MSFVVRGMSRRPRVNHSEYSPRKKNLSRHRETLRLFLVPEICRGLNVTFVSATRYSINVTYEIFVRNDNPHEAKLSECSKITFANQFCHSFVSMKETPYT